MECARPRDRDDKPDAQRLKASAAGRVQPESDQVKIEHIDLFELKVPPIEPVARYRPNIFNLTICRIHTDEDIVGIGEVSLNPPHVAEWAATHIGDDPRALDPFAQPDPFACALLDIAGQASGLPLHRFFGEKVRDRIPVSYWSCPMEPHETAEQAEIGAGLHMPRRTHGQSATHRSNTVRANCLRGAAI